MAESIMEQIHKRYYEALKQGMDAWGIVLNRETIHLLRFEAMENLVVYPQSSNSPIEKIFGLTIIPKVCNDYNMTIVDESLGRTLLQSGDNEWVKSATCSTI